MVPATEWNTQLRKWNKEAVVDASFVCECAILLSIFGSYSF